MSFCSISSIFFFQNINCYNPNRHVTQITSSSSNSKTTDPVIPARYKITSKTNYGDLSTTQSFPAEYFPQVEYPESVTDSSKPFYISSSPFPNDVKTTFNSLVAKGKSKVKTAPDYSWTQNGKSKEKEQPSPQKVGMNEITDTKGNEINDTDKETIETLHDDISPLKVAEDIQNVEIPNLTLMEQSAECKDSDYIVDLINDMDEIIKNLTSTETQECNEGNNNTVHSFEIECSKEFKFGSDMTPNNNDAIIELNGNSFREEEHPGGIKNPLLQDSDTNDELTSLTSLLNEYIRNATSVEDTQSEFCSIGLVANESNTFCIPS